MKKRADILKFGLLSVGVFACIICFIAECHNCGFGDSLLAFWFFVPAAGFTASLLNWFLIKFYKSRIQFSVITSLLSEVFSFFTFSALLIHYEFPIYEMFFEDLNEFVGFMLLWFGIGFLLSLILSVLSGVFSNSYYKWTQE